MKSESLEGILLIDKPQGKTSFSLVAALRRILSVQKIGHAGTLDPFATGVMVLLIGRSFTRLSDSFLTCSKEYMARIKLGQATDSYDIDGSVTHTSNVIPDQNCIEKTLSLFQGDISQVPPMYSAKKIKGQKLYDLARQGKTVERDSVSVNVNIELIGYDYPYLDLKVACSKGTYIRSLAHDIGVELGSYAFLEGLKRTKSGSFKIDACMDGQALFDPIDCFDEIKKRLLKSDYL